MTLKLPLGCKKIIASKSLVSLKVKSRRFSFCVALFIKMATLIKSGYRGLAYLMYEIAGKKVKVHTVPEGRGGRI
jgi:hypothetical protein